MSFILDALKKSESERQRQSGPALFEVKIAPPRSRFAAWGAVIGALLVVNFVAVGIVLWRGSAARSAAPAGAVTRAGAPAPAAARAAGPAAVSSPVPPPVPPEAARVEPRAASPADSRAAPSAAAGAAGPAAPSSVNTLAAAAAASSAPPAADNPDDLAPAVEPRGHDDARSATGVLRATESGLPTYQDAAAEQGADIPDLKLDLHVYDAQPDRRFVFLEADAHMLKLREGDATPRGVRVERITPDGVILSYRGKEFVLQRQ